MSNIERVYLLLLRITTTHVHSRTRTRRCAVSDLVPGSVGRLVPEMSAKIVDDDGRILPPGKDNVGELCMRGPNVMLGYLNNPSATASTLVDGWLHSGDIAYRDERGNYFIVDRKKELIKVSGHQVAPAELEGLLLQHPGVMDAAVVPKNDERAGERPVAFIVRKTPVVGNAPGEQVRHIPSSMSVLEAVTTSSRLAESTRP